MNKLLESIFYSFGFNFSGYDVNRELEFLKQNLPPNFLHRHFTDLGCGDGTVTQKLVSILEPKSVIGYDLYPSLITRAVSHGLDARVLDIEKPPLSDDLGVLWGVLHHLTSPPDTLRRLCQNFKTLIVRESIDNHRLFESGHRFSPQELISLVKSVAPNAKFLYSPHKSVLIFID